MAIRAKITKRPYVYKGKTEDRWLVLWTDLKGTRREKWFQNKRHAEAYAIKIDRELADNIDVADGATITFAKACKAWLKHEEGRADSRNRNADLTKGSLAAKQGVAKNHLLPFFGNTRLNKIDSPSIKRFIDDQARRFSHWTARRHKTLVKQVLDFAVNNDWLRLSPLTNRPRRGRNTHYSAASSNGASRGRMIRILVPPPGLLSKSIRPPKRLVTML